MNKQTPALPLAPHRFLLPLLAAATLPLASAGAAVINLNTTVADSLGYTPTQVYYAMDSITPGGTNTTADSSANGNTGSLYAGTENIDPTLVTGKFGNAIYFQGTTNINDVNPYLYASNHSSLQLAGTSFTLGTWMNFNDIRSGSYNIDIVSKGARSVASSPGYTFYLGKSSTAGNWGLYFETRDGTVIGEVSSGLLSLNLEEGDWYHFGLSFDHTTSEVVFYFNGEEVATRTASVQIGAGTDYFYVNERGTGTWSSWYDGAYDDFFITSGVHTFSAPIPEPSTVALLALCSGACLLIRRKRA